MVGTKPVTSKQMPEVKKQRVSVFGRIDHEIYAVGLEKVVPPVNPILGVAVTPISNDPRNKVVLSAGDCRFKARLICLG